MAQKTYVFTGGKIQPAPREKEDFLLNLKEAIILSLGQGGYLTKVEVRECMTRLKKK